MAGKLIFLGAMAFGSIAAVVMAVYRHKIKTAEQQHEKEMLREQQDYDTLMEYAEEDAREDNRP